MSYAWTITRDHVGTDAAGTTGPRNADESLLTVNAERFRMKDDDGVLYYEGVIGGDHYGFEPLEDFGMPNAGCTTIEYRVNGAWRVL